jgi:hypothetical protein
MIPSGSGGGFGDSTNPFVKSRHEVETTEDHRSLRGIMDDMTEDAILDKMLEPFARCLTPAVAQQIADLRADPTTQARIDELAAKSNEGELTEAERQEYAAYVEAIDLIGILQAKARAILASPPSA